MGRRSRGSKRFVATVVFTDIVGSTGIASELGDRGWRRLLGDHHALVRRELRTYRGREIDTAGDGFFASFDTPAAALSWAHAIGEGMWDLGVEVRAGAHLGECELIEGKVGGIAVHIGARVASAAGPGQILVTQTVKDTLTGSDVRFIDAGVHGLKGVPGDWHLFQVEQPSRTRPKPALSRPPPEPGGPSPRRRARLVVIAAAIVLLAGALAGYLVIRDGPSHNTIPRKPPAFVGAVERIDPKTGRVLVTIPAPVSFRSDRTVMADGGGFVWVAGYNSFVYKINPGSNTIVARIPVRVPLDVAYGGGSLWVTSVAVRAYMSAGPPTLFRVNPRTNQVSDRIPLPGHGTDLQSLAYGYGAVWLGWIDGRLSQVSVKTGKIRTLHIGGLIGSVAAGDGSVWAIDVLGGTLIRVNPRTLAVTEQSLPGDQSAMATGGGAVWVTDRTGGVVDRVPSEKPGGIQSVAVGTEPYRVALGDGFVWVLGGEGTLTQIDPDGISPVRTIQLIPANEIAAVHGTFTGGITAGAHGVWVTLNEQPSG
jgi:class 3 adenylate cyclase/streptogramin lyase